MSAPVLDALPVRMRAKVRPTDTGCWEWIAARNANGYGIVGFRGTSGLAHRVVYELLAGPIPAGLVLDHTCTFKPCVHPAHLEAVPQVENARRWAASRTHCKHGHRLTTANTVIKFQNGGTVRRCVTCLAGYNARRTRVSAA